MNTRRFVLHLIIGLLTFLIGVTAAIALGGFNPLERLISNHSRRQLTIPPQRLDGTSEAPERYQGCRYGRPRTADLRYHGKSLTPPPPPAPVAPFEEETESLTPSTPPRSTR